MNIWITGMLNLREVIRQNYLKFLNREPDIEGLEHYFLEIQNNRIKISDLETIFRNSEEGKSIISQKEKIQVDKSIMKLDPVWNIIVQSIGQIDSWLR